MNNLNVIYKIFFLFHTLIVLSFKHQNPLGGLDALSTWYLHRVVAESSQQHRHHHDSATSSPAWLGIFITGLDSAVTSRTRQHHCQHDSAVQSLAWLDIYIAPWPSCLGSTITGTTRQRKHIATWSSTSTIYDFSSKQTHCQLILILFINMFGSRANASVLMHCLAPLWSIYILKTHVWRH
jgi:hypothetical protein